MPNSFVQPFAMLGTCLLSPLPFLHHSENSLWPGSIDQLMAAAKMRVLAVAPSP